MDSELKLKSKIGQGSEFYFSIPLEVGMKIEEEVVNENIGKTLSGHILLVEDNKANQLFMKVLFKKFNLTFDMANNGQEAIDLYDKSIDGLISGYDCILMDENMPIMDGITSTKNILQIEKEKSLQHTPIIALTANALKGDRERFLEVGMDDYLSKPVNKDHLKSMLYKLIK